MVVVEPGQVRRVIEQAGSLGVDEAGVVLAEALEAAMGDTSVRVVVLTGGAGTFCSGGDISTIQRSGAPKRKA